MTAAKMHQKLSHQIGRFVGRHFNGRKGVERLLRIIHHPDRQKTSWITSIERAYPGGPRFHIETRWAIEWQIYFYGTQDRRIHDWVVGRARPDWVGIDAGANCGFFSTLLASLCAEVHSFEPVPWLAERAEGNLKLNGLTNCWVNRLALSDRAGFAMMNLPTADDANWGTSSIMHRADNCTGTTAKVETTTLDEYCSNFGRIDFIKIDVEGAEHLVLRGGRKILAKHRPAIIFERNAESGPESVAILRELGYRITTIDGRSLSLPIDRHWPVDLLATQASAEPTT